MIYAAVHDHVLHELEQQQQHGSAELPITCVTTMHASPCMFAWT